MGPGQRGELTKNGIPFPTGGPRLAQGRSRRSPDLQNGAKLPQNDHTSTKNAQNWYPLAAKGGVGELTFPGFFYVGLPGGPQGSPKSPQGVPSGSQSDSQGIARAPQMTIWRSKWSQKWSPGLPKGVQHDGTVAGRRDAQLGISPNRSLPTRGVLTSSQLN